MSSDISANHSPAPSADAVPKPAPAASSAAVVPAHPAAASVAPAAPPPAPKPNPLAHLPLPFQGVDYTLKGYHADATVEPGEVVTAAEHLYGDGFALDTVTGVDWIAEGKMEVVYDYFHPDKTLRAVVRTRIPRDRPELPTISKVFPGANWHERETHDFFGINFVGHPNLAPFLLPEDADYHPLKKDFSS
jgi:NADH-quinone oxidoreductase subunit C